MHETQRLSILHRIVVVLVGFFLVAPTLVVIPLSFANRDSFKFPPDGWSLDYYKKFFTDPDWQSSLMTSLKLGLAVMVVATILGVLASIALVRGRFPGKGFVNAMLMAPMIVPVIVIAVAVYTVFLKWQLSGTFMGFLLAHTVLALPFVIVSVSQSLREMDSRLDLAGKSLGADAWTRFRSITLPLVLPGVLSGAVFAFVTSFDEVVTALFIQSPDVRTLPVKMYSSVTSEIDPTIAAASTTIMVITSLLILVPQLVRRRETH